MATLAVPAEIWGKIFELCCNDGGKMGRSLALVSRYIYAVSKPYQYRSVALIGGAAISSFARLLDADADHECRRVKCLFMSTFRPEKNVLDYVQNGPLQNPIPSLLTPHGDGFQPEAKYEIIANMYRIFEAIAPSLEILHVVMGFCRDSTFFPVVFPSLVELAIQGPFYEHEDCNDEFCCDTLYPSTPSLRRLYLTDVFTCVNDRTHSAIKHYAPYLTRLRIQCADGYIESSKPFLRQLLLSPRAQGVGAEEEEEEGNRLGHSNGNLNGESQFPETLERILLHPGTMLFGRRCGASYMIRYMAIQELEKFVREDSRVVLFKESPWIRPFSTVHGYIEGKGQWLDRVAGGEGCWEDARD